MTASSRLDRLGLPLLLALTAAAYAGALGAGLLWDDQTLILENARLADPSTLGALLTGDLWAPASSGYYRPVLLATFFVDRQLFGLSPLGWHAHSLLWHLVAVALLHRLLVRLLGAGLPTLAGAALFALHPAQSEAVVWLSARNDLLAAAFSLGALACLSGPGRVVLGAALWAAALLSKESAILVPMLLVALDGARGRLGDRAAVVRYGALCAALLGVVGLRAGLGIGQAALPEPAGWAALGDTLPTVVGTYAGLVALPWPLLVSRHVDYLPAGWSPAALGLFVPVALGVLAARLPAPRRGLALAGLGGAAALLAPALVAVASYGLLSERYLYLPLAGVAVAVAALLPSSRAALVPALPAAALAVALLGARLPDWASQRALFEADVARAPTCYNRTQVARLFDEEGRPAEALAALAPVVPGDGTCPRGARVAVLAALRGGRADLAADLADRTRAAAPRASPGFDGLTAMARFAAGRRADAVALATPAAAALPCGEATAVLAAAAWAEGDADGYEGLLATCPDPAALATWTARVLALAGDDAALARLVATGVAPGRPAGPLAGQ